LSHRHFLDMSWIPSPHRDRTRSYAAAKGLAVIAQPLIDKIVAEIYTYCFLYRFYFY